MVQLAEGHAQDVESFCHHVKNSFGECWKTELCEGQVVEGEIGVGSPALLVISSAALRSLELLRYCWNECWNRAVPCIVIFF